MADVISLMLLIGVTVSAAVFIFGLVLLLVQRTTGYNEALTSQLLLAPQGQAVFPTSIGGVFAGALALKPFAVIELGALLLIATPVFRVAASAVLFYLEKDPTYTVITLIVFALLMISIFWVGAAEGG